MEPTSGRPWYKKKRHLIPLGIIALVSLGGSGLTSTPSETSQSAAAALEALQSSQETTDASANFDSAPAARQVNSPVSETTQVAKSKVVPTQTASQPQPSSLSNDNYYTNVDGNQIHSPAYSNVVPASATARCRDGTYSFSQHRSGTCSHHGGVSSWL